MQNKQIRLIQAIIEIFNPLIGYEFCDDLKEILFKTIDFLCLNFNFSLEETSEIKAFLIKIFQINRYSDYLLLSRNDESEDQGIFKMGKKYFNYLQMKDNKTHCFFKDSFLAQLDRQVIYGEPSYIRLKAYIALSGVFYPVSKESVIVLLKKLVFFGDFFALEVIKFIDENNSELLSEICNCIKDMLYELKTEEELVNIYSKEILENTKIILAATKQQMDKNLIDHRLFNYLSTTNDSYEKRLEKIKTSKFESSKRKKVGY